MTCISGAELQREVNEKRANSSTTARVGQHRRRGWKGKESESGSGSARASSPPGSEQDGLVGSVRSSKTHENQTSATASAKHVPFSTEHSRFVLCSLLVGGFFFFFFRKKEKGTGIELGRREWNGVVVGGGKGRGGGRRVNQQ